MFSETDRNKLQHIFSRYPEVRAVYLFGSKATGNDRNNSDIDLGLFTDDNIRPSFKLEVLKDLTAEGFDNVDLVLLTEADPIIRYEAVRLNKLLYSTGDFDRGETYSNVVRKYLDLLPYLELQRKAYKQRILHAET